MTMGGSRTRAAVLAAGALLLGTVALPGSSAATSALEATETQGR